MARRRMARSAASIAVALALVIGTVAETACQQQTEGSARADNPPPRPNRPPIPLTWDPDHRLKSGVASATFVLTQESGQIPFQLQATFRGWPRGTTFRLGKEQPERQTGTCRCRSTSERPCWRSRSTR